MRVFLLGLAFAAITLAARTLDVYFIDVEGGQSTLIVSPTGESLLVDAGYSGFGGRDPNRIAAAAKLAGVKQIDYLLITHYHQDHVGGVAELAQKLPIKHFLDHGANTETGAEPEARYAKYKAVVGSNPHTVATPGKKIPIRGLGVEVLSGAGAVITSALKGAGAPNPLCASAQKIADDTTENSQSLGLIVTFGRFRFLDLGDLTWNKELAMACPNNLIGTVDVYLTTHHGGIGSGPPALVHALKPRVAIMNNGATKGGTPPTWQIVRDTPGLQDLWQLHYSVAGGKDHNVEEKLIANPDADKDQGNWIKLSAESDGSFTVTNGRNQFSKTYKRQLEARH
jgi:beta-lactamase superfamily II metal-dependent hydrolase